MKKRKRDIQRFGAILASIGIVLVGYSVLFWRDYDFGLFMLCIGIIIMVVSELKS